MLTIVLVWLAMQTLAAFVLACFYWEEDLPSEDTLKGKMIVAMIATLGMYLLLAVLLGSLVNRWATASRRMVDAMRKSK